jgi:uncharacterized protein YjbI with pentapeptide repeats
LSSTRIASALSCVVSTSASIFLIAPRIDRSTENASFGGAIPINVQANGANLDHIFANGINGTGIQLAGASLVHANLVQANFTGASLQGGPPAGGLEQHDVSGCSNSNVNVRCGFKPLWVQTMTAWKPAYI